MKFGSFSFFKALPRNLEFSFRERNNNYFFVQQSNKTSAKSEFPLCSLKKNPRLRFLWNSGAIFIFHYFFEDSVVFNHQQTNPKRKKMAIRVCVFGSSATTTKQKYLDESLRLGELIAENGFICVNGAGRFGVMGAVNEGCYRKNGKIRGIIHSMFNVDLGEDTRIKDLVVVDGWDLSERKTELFEESDCVIIMPGGVGTFDEMWDGICAKSLNMKNLGLKPICVVNIDGFYDGFIANMHRAYEDGVLYHPVEKYFRTETDVADALNWCVETLRHSRRESIHEFEIVRKVDRQSVSQEKTKPGKHHHHHHHHRMNPTLTVCLLSLGYILGWTLQRQSS